MKKKSVKNNFYSDDDDCAICRAMKMADERGRDLSLSELKDAFAEANKNRPYKQRPKVLGEAKNVSGKAHG
jgi:hypothetical protein